MKSSMTRHSRLKRFVLGTMLALVAPLALATPPSEAQADRLLEILRARAMIEQMLSQMEAEQERAFDQQMADYPIDDEQRARLERIADKGNQAVKRALAWENLKPIYHEIYRSTFNAEETQALIDLYSSPAGQMILDRMPQLMQKSMSVVQQMLFPVIQEMQDALVHELPGMPGDAPPDDMPSADAEAPTTR